jgi:hypothetical protein
MNFSREFKGLQLTFRKDSSNPLATVSNGAACHPWVGRNPRAQCSGQVGAGRRPYRASQHGAHLSCGIWSK